MRTHKDTSRNRDPHRHAATLPLMPRCRLTATATCLQMLTCTTGHMPTLALQACSDAPLRPCAQHVPCTYTQPAAAHTRVHARSSSHAVGEPTPSPARRAHTPLHFTVI